MGSRVDDLMEKVRAGLADLPEGTVRQALDHYREYIAEALEAGRAEDEILHRLGDPQEIIAQIRAEASLARAEQNPGPMRLSGAARQVLSRIAPITAQASLVLGVSIPFSLAIGFYVTAGAAFAGAVGAAALMAYGITEIAPVYVWEKVGTAGVGVLGAAIFAATGLGLWQAAKGITRLALRILRRGLGRKNGSEQVGKELSTGGTRKAFLACAVASLLGVGMIVPSGLPLRYFSIWNSMKSENLVLRTASFKAAEIREIEAVTLNSMILLKAAETSSKTIQVSYEEPDWMAGAVALAGGKLAFREESNGRLPFLGFIARHEGMTAVTINVPPGYRARAVTLASKGGHIDVAVTGGEIRVRTLTGNVRLNARGGPFAIRAVTRKGTIVVGGRAVDGGVHTSGAGAGNTVEIESVEGTVEIE